MTPSPAGIPLHPTPSRLCLGTASFGSEIPRETAFCVLDRFLELGGNFLDTAHIYAAWRPGCWGNSERLLGDWMRARGVRDRIVLATKGGHPPLDRMDVGRCSRADLESDLTESLERLGTDWIDLYWLHRDDPGRPAEEIVETLNAFVRDGRIRAFGASNWTWNRIESARLDAERNGLQPFAAAQPGWSLATYPGPPPIPGMLLLANEDLEYPARTGLPVAAYTPQAKGYFGSENVDWARGGFAGPAPKGGEYDSLANRRKLLEAARIGSARGLSANQIALAYLMSNPFPVYPIIGTGNIDHLEEAFGAMDIALNPEEIGRLVSG